MGHRKRRRRHHLSALSVTVSVRALPRGPYACAVSAEPRAGEGLLRHRMSHRDAPRTAPDLDLLLDLTRLDVDDRDVAQRPISGVDFPPVGADPDAPRAAADIFDQRVSFRLLTSKIPIERARPNGDVDRAAVR